MDTDYISADLARFRDTLNPRYLLRAIALVAKQKRVPELFYSIWCELRFRPAVVKSCQPGGSEEIGRYLTPIVWGEDVWPREALVERFSPAFAVDKLPTDFYGARRESIAVGADSLVLGEYGHFKKRVFYITRETCRINNFYSRDPLVRHIHAVHAGRSPNEYFLTTGDAAKYLDSWRHAMGEFDFSSRIKRSLAGYTAMAKIGDQFYFASDFSSRLNYLERLDGSRFFFPEPASRMYVVAFFATHCRFLISLHKSLGVFSNRGAISVFDASARHFVYCDDCAGPTSTYPYLVRSVGPMPLRT